MVEYLISPPETNESPLNAGTVRRWELSFCTGPEFQGTFVDFWECTTHEP